MEYFKKKNTSRFQVVFAMLLFVCFSLQAQRVSITGVVKDASTGEEIIGVNISEKGTTNGTITDINGKFTINLNSPTSTIVVSYVGYEQQEFVVGNKRDFIVNLKEDAKLLGEVIVIGYGVVRKNDATGSVTAIKPDVLNKGLALNAQDALQGKVAGVNIISHDGTPGGGSQIRIRGGSSLNASNDPLIVIDGMVMSNDAVKGVANPLSVVNPNDIESFTILKDASATAIYGSRASNGVILITTKKGTISKYGDQKPKFSYSGNASVSNLIKRIEVMTADELRNYAKYLKISDSNMSYLGNSDTDWQNQIYRPAIGTDHSLTMTGGIKNIPYRLGIGITYQDGIILTSNMHRGTISGNLNPTFFDKHLTLNVNVRGMYIGNRWADGGVVSAALAMDPTQNVKDNTYPEFGGYFQRANDALFGDPTWTHIPNSQAVANPVSTLMLKDDRSKSYQFIGSIDADYKVHGFEDLHLHLNLAGDYGYGTQRTIIDPHSYTNNYYGWDGTDSKTKYTKTFTAYAQYLKDVTSSQHIDVMGGYEYQHYLKQIGVNNGWGTYPETYPDASKRGEKFNKYYREYANQLFLVSYFGRLNYSAFNKYLFTLTFRTDASSYFSPENRWGLFPSAAFAWKINEESFLKDVKFISDLKLRLGWGITGQQELGLGDAPYLTIFDVNQNYAYYPISEDESGNYIYSGTYKPRAINTSITWEKTATYNIGLDFSFLNGRISGAIDAYSRLTTDLINEIDLPGGTNFSNKTVANVGSLSNKGIEFAINARAIDNKDFSWDLSFNATYNINKIEKLTVSDDPDYYIRTGGISNGKDNTIQAHKEGYPAWSYFVFETKKDTNGNYYFVDRFEDGQITDLDKYCYKSALAPFLFGLSSTFNYKQWDLSLAMRANIGNYVYNDYLANSLRGAEKSNIVSSKTGGFNNVSKAAYNVFYGDGFRSDKLNNWFFSDYLVENASFLRLDKVTLGYNLIKPGMRVYLTVQNPFVITKYRGLDPEKPGGIDNNFYPRSMVTMIGASYNF
ncbi:TonB-dependent receptor [Paludibacter sp.]